MELKDYRAQIDAVDDEIVRLFQERMDIAANIAAFKKENGLPILQTAREREKKFLSMSGRILS
ncbi:MAG: chorismate mutase [Sutterellaceae bacterium]|nr:chorismate mutase [Sutterellaceae bacterium]